MTRLFLAAAGIIPLCVHAAPSQAPAGAPAEVRKVVEDTVNSVIDVLKDKANDRDARRRKIFAIMDGVGDFDLMGKLTLGPAHWKEFSEAQRKEFIESFKRTVRDSCFDKLEVYTNETAEFDPPAPGDSKGKYRMQMYVLSKGQRYQVLFKLYRPSSWKIYDMEIEGISLIRTYAAQYDQVLQAGTPKDLLAKLKQKAMAVPDVLKSDAPPKKEAGRMP